MFLLFVNLGVLGLIFYAFNWWAEGVTFGNLTWGWWAYICEGLICIISPKLLSYGLLTPEGLLDDKGGLNFIIFLFCDFSSINFLLGSGLLIWLTLSFSSSIKLGGGPNFSKDYS